MLGQLCVEPVELDCEPELDWLLVDVEDAVLVVLVAAKAIPTEESAATKEIARIE
jgi:hypothetical protein